MTDQEKADLELSLSLIDQKISSDEVIKSNKDLVTAIDMEVDSSLDLTDSKGKSKKAIDTETDVINKSSDIVDGLNYTRSETSRAEKRYLNILDRRAEIESKIGLVDYSKIDKQLHDKIVKELEERLKSTELANKKQEEDADFEEEVNDNKRKSESDYLKEAEKYHKKRISMFKRISKAHGDYMNNSNSSFVGRMIMGGLGKGTGELSSLIDSTTDMIPGMKTAKRVGSFARSHWADTRENKRQKRIERTAKVLRERDRAPVESEERKEKSKEDNQRKGTEGILGIGATLEKIFVFLKKLGETMMLMNLFKGLFGMIGGALGGLAGLIGNGITTAFSALGLTAALGGLTSVLGSIAGLLGIKIPKPDLPDSGKPPVQDKSKSGANPDPKEEKKKPKKEKAKRSPKGRGKGLRFGVGALGMMAASYFYGDEIDAALGEQADQVWDASLLPGLLGLNPITAGAAALTPASTVSGSREMEELDKVKAENLEKNKTGKVDNEKLIKEAHERAEKLKQETKTKEIEKNKEKFKIEQSKETEISNSDIEKAKNDLEKTTHKSNIQSNVVTSQNSSTVNNINNNSISTKQFPFSPYEFRSNNNHSRGQIK